MTRADVRARIEDIGIVPAVRVPAVEDARFAIEAVHAAGIPIAEVTMTIPGALDVILEMAKRFPRMVIGAGTVLDGETAQRCLDAGARFLTTTGMAPELVEFAQRHDVVFFPGALTPSEVIAAWKAGADFVKIFPCAPMGGAQYIRTLKVPLRQVPLIASGGVNQHTVADFILAGASAVGIGAQLIPHEAVQERNAAQIHELARRYLHIVKEARTRREESQHAT